VIWPSEDADCVGLDARLQRGMDAVAGDDIYRSIEQILDRLIEADDMSPLTVGR
jgi:hypothetical protein